ncbi:hypothetical protein QBC46DRAFT_21629 [Diplogelasinospora grovesii]|uniref:Uncharacterized protein n=1 Tax=Diplogelasinospora grovesii TaxID=303347 RepID=A0AAN6NDJ2_9PEZI|nr:hypothetical protein QBC46DRAFT_21629 [Diplogelasinospora grovesii]
MPYSTAPSANESSDNSFDAPPTAAPPLRAPVLSVHTMDGFISSSAVEQPAMRLETIHTALPSPSHHVPNPRALWAPICAPGRDGESRLAEQLAAAVNKLIASKPVSDNASASGAKKAPTKEGKPQVELASTLDYKRVDKVGTKNRGNTELLV